MIIRELESQDEKVTVAAFLMISAVAITWGLTQGVKNIKEFLIGYEEVPAVSTTGNGEFHGRISNDETEIAYTLSYSDLEGTVQQAHIHLGQPGVNGGISVFLCTNLGNGPAGTQLCPSPPATINGVIRSADVIGPSGEGITAGELSELIKAMHAGPPTSTCTVRNGQVVKSGAKSVTTTETIMKEQSNK